MAEVIKQFLTGALLKSHNPTVIFFTEGFTLK